MIKICQCLLTSTYPTALGQRKAASGLVLAPWKWLHLLQLTGLQQRKKLSSLLNQKQAGSTHRLTHMCLVCDFTLQILSVSEVSPKIAALRSPYHLCSRQHPVVTSVLRYTPGVYFFRGIFQRHIKACYLVLSVFYSAAHSSNP